MSKLQGQAGRLPYFAEVSWPLGTDTQRLRRSQRRQQMEGGGWKSPFPRGFFRADKESCQEWPLFRVGGTSQVIGRRLGGASQVHARYMHGTSQVQAASKPTESQDRAYGRRGNQPLAPSALSLPVSAFALSFHAGFDEASGRHCELSYPGWRRFFPSISTNEKAG